MKNKEKSYYVLIMVILFAIISNTEARAQEKNIHVPTKETRKIRNTEQFYELKKTGNKYMLVNFSLRENVLQEAYDTIVFNSNFIKTVNKDSISIFKIQNLEKLNTPNILQAYFVKDAVIEVLTNAEAQYYDASFTKINTLPDNGWLPCGAVPSTEYRIKYDANTKQYWLSLKKSEDNFLFEKTTLRMKGLPKNVKNVSFLDSEKYIVDNINRNYNQFPNLIQITNTTAKVGIYAYDIEKAIYSAKKKKEYLILPTGDSIAIATRLSENKLGRITLHQILPVIYDSIKTNTHNGLVYLYKDNLIGIYPNHITTDFKMLKEETKSFFKIIKNGKHGWLDKKTFKEYYTE